MSDLKIPDDVRRRAIEIHLSERKAKGRTLGLTDYTIAIANGIMAERERCAKIAEAAASNDAGDYTSGWNDACESVASAIRRPK